jgi:hypothetical protein
MTPAPNFSPLLGKVPASATRRRAISAPKAIDANRKPVMDILFDSGAFSAWKLGKSIDVDVYCDYLLRNKHWMGAYVALDVINPDSPEVAAKASFENYMHMRSRGLDPIPVFHVKENISWLYRMIDAGATYIGLSASSLVSRNNVNDWYGYCWDKLTDREGKPLIKAHAFGEGRYDALVSFPWYSADSATWIYAAQRSGRIPIGNGKSVAHRNDGLNIAVQQDIQALCATEGQAFGAHLAKYGIDRRVFDNRDGDSNIIGTYLALMFYLEQEKRVTAKCPIKHKVGGLFNGATEASLVKLSPLHLPEIKYYSVINKNFIAWASLAFAGASRGLMSYFYVEGTSDTKPRDYYQNLLDFVYDPYEVCSTRLPMKKTFNILQEYITK